MSSPASSHAHPLPSTGNRLKLHPTPNSTSSAARNSIITSSAKGWSPLQINKRTDGLTSPRKNSPAASPDPTHMLSPGDAASPRRTSSSFKHVTKNSLVSNSPFKSPTTVQGQQAAGIWNDNKQEVLHEKRASRVMGASPEKAVGAASTPKAAIGLGISATRRPSTRTPSGSGSALNGTRRVSSERKVVIPPTSLERRVSGERSVSGSKENDSPDVRDGSGKKTARPSIGLGRLAKNEYVSKSPFVISKRVPSGERRDSLTGVGPSPKTIPMESDDVFGSPSPRRTSLSRRRVSPSPTTRLSDVSPTPSPPRGLQATIPSAGPSPLSQPISIPSQATPTPTPGRSSMTPSRRLKGPRELSEMSLDSPSKLAKTVTFQTVPDVKEFDVMSAEASMDGSFEVEESQWSDGDSLDDVNLDESIGSIDSLSRLRVANPDSPTVEGSTEDGHVPDESTTANFVDELIAEGLFSPPQISTPAFADPPTFTSIVEDRPPALSTPLLGETIQATPILASVDQVQNDRDSAGIPYGRTHHAQRAVEAHTQPIHPNIAQPDIPQQSGQMLFNGNAAKPSLPYSTPYDVAPIKATQAGPMPDPFITIQTATKVLAPERTRSEDGIPLGRTSHVERMQAARMLATQSLGLGMPRSPAVSKDLHSVAPPLPSKDKPVEQVQGDVARRDVEAMPKSKETVLEEEDEEVLFDISFDGVRKASNLVELPRTDVAKQQQAATETPKKKWPPIPEQLDLPSPVASPTKEDEQVELLSPKSPDKSRFALPFIGLTSPFFTQVAKVPTAGSVSGSSTDGTDHEDNERPLTPPPVRREPKDDSPHRIPSFEFEEISLQAVELPAFRTARVASPVKASSSVASRISTSTSQRSDGVSNLSNSTSTTSARSVASPVKNDFGSKAQESNGESTTTRVRQRISREMIRETINQRLADGSISRRGSTQALMGVSSHYADLAPTPPRPVSMGIPPRHAEKSLPIPPLEQAIPMMKAHTTGSLRPALQPRGQIQSAHELLKATSRDGMIGDPKSGLDVLIGNPTLAGSISSNSDAAILKPQPVKVVSGTKEREDAIIARRREKERDASGGSIESSGSRKSRRSMSMSDAPNVTARKGKNSRLTLGIDEDEVGILESFRQEAEQIGANRGYKVKERRVVKASYGPIGHGRSGDVHTGKAWKALRRPSDMNEHATQLREIRKQEASNGKASGTIFVKVLGIENLEIPLPEQQTFFCVTLDNSIDYIRTPYSTLGSSVAVNQEFSLVETSSFEFSLSLDIRTDPHIISLIHAKRNVTPAPTPAPTLHPPGHVKSGSGLRGLFGSPRKPRRPESIIAQPTPILNRTQTIADYFPKDATAPGGSGVTSSQPGGKIKSITIAKTHVAFKPIAKQCDAKLLEIRYPLFAMGKTTSSGERKSIGKITLQIFRLPPLPGLQQDQLPACVDDALRGIRHHAWWEHEYHEGVLTQSGGDCAHPKRRLFKVIGGNLVAINEVTKKTVASIDLRQCVAVTDLNTDDTASIGGKRAGSPVSRMTLRMRDEEMGEVRPRSFRLEFGEEGGEDGIDFWADRQEDKDIWMDTLRGLVGRIPSNPLWAEVLSQKQREAREKAVMKKMGSSSSLRAQARAQEVQKKRESAVPSK